MPFRPIVHINAYGDFGGGKSTFLATMPKPLLVFMFDPFGKDAPYVKRARGGRIETGIDTFGTPFQDLYSPRTSQRIIRLEYYLDMEPTAPNAYHRFLNRMGSLHKEYDQWKTVGLDSTTMMELAARKWEQYALNPRTKEPRQWWAGATDKLEEMLMGRFGSLPMNVFVISHIDKDKDEAHGSMVRMPALPGRMRGRMGAGYSELYHFYVARGENGEKLYCVQTASDSLYSAATQIDAPDPMVWTLAGGYSDLWINWDASEEATQG